MKTLLTDEHFWSVEFPKKRPYVLKGERLPLFSLLDVQSVLQTAELLKQDVYVVENENGQYVKDYFVGHLNPDSTWVEKNQELNEAFRKRYVVKVQGLERWDRATLEVCRSLEDRIKGYVDAHLYLAPARGGSFGLHTDPNDVFVCMLQGRKQFELPDHNFTVELDAGDWLYIPKDAPHKGSSITNSVMLSFGAKEFLSDGLRSPLPLKWYSSLMDFKPSAEWYQKAAEAEEDFDISAGKP
jgi:ribosomal protein L16 Arg81 hydroxylase